MRYKLKDIFDLQMGKTPSRNNEEYWNSNDYKWISIADITKAGQYISDTKEFLSEKAVQESGIKIIPANTVVMSFKLSIGKVAITSEDMFSNEAIMAFHDKHVVELLPEFVFYSFKYKNWEDITNTAVKGKTLNKATLSEVELEIVPLERQREIVSILNNVGEIVNSRKRELLGFDDLIKARFVEMFGDPVQNTKGWDTNICKNLTSKIGSGATPKGGRGSYGTEGISLIRSMNVYNNRFEHKDLAYITDEQADKLSNVIIEENDVLLNITGASVARCCVVPKELIPARVNQHVAIVRCKDRLLPEFLCNMFTEDSFQRLLWSIATSGGATREAITKQQIENLVLIVPPIELQEEFEQFANQIDKSKSIVQKALDKTQLLFDSLMQEYFG